MKKEISLVTGGCGFIGSHLCNKLISIGHKVVVIDNLSTGKKNNQIYHKNIHYINGDINNHECVKKVFSDYELTYVFHLAAVVGVKLTIEKPLLVLEDLKGIDLLYKFSAQSKIKKFYFASSSEVYGEPFSIPQNELTTPLNSRLPYAIVKNAGEAYSIAYKDEYGLESTNLRFFNTYGPMQRSDFVVSIFINAAIANKPLEVYGDGLQTRTFCYVTDTVNCIAELINLKKNVNSINIGSEHQININQLAKEIISLTNSKSEIKYLPPLEKGDMTRRQPCNKLLNSIMGNYKFITLREGLNKTINYHLMQKNNSL